VSAVQTPDGIGSRTATFGEVAANAARLAHALRKLGVTGDERVATFMWNNQEHLEAYFAVPCMGAVLHPLNIRLFPEQIVYIANHAEDKVVVVDNTLLPLLAKLLPEMKTVEHVIVNGPADLSALSATASELGVGVHDYAGIVAAEPDTFDWPDVDETSAAAMCYTSGTTGNPKGVVYSHRSIYLHALGAATPDVFAMSADDLILGIVPQFHVLAWGLPYSAFLTGASLAMPDRFLTPEPLAAFVKQVRPNKAGAVPTVWAGLLQYISAAPDADISSLKEAIVGGSAVPPSLMKAYDDIGMTIVHAWGMTEMSPLGSAARPLSSASDEERLRQRLSQGRFAGPVQARLVGPAGEVLPWDGETVGELEVRGPWVTATYYGDSEPDPGKFEDGWLRTGDVGHIDPDGYLTLTDRAKDVIKSGGEWISSVELETQIMGHPAVAEASVVGVPDDRWGERPLASVVLRPGQAATVEELEAYLEGKVAHWQVPERWAFIDEVPKTSVGKFDKKVLRQRYAAGELPVVGAGAARA
jgi:fatty-acyl-CoA synthase